MVHVDLFQTLADPTRRLIIESLQGSEQAVNDIVARVRIHQSGVSRHLRILHEAGFVRVRPDGVRRLYSLRPERFCELDAWLAGFRSHWEMRLDKFAEALGRNQRTRRGSRVHDK
jgi:DNA-binding transcriptional ArsR family regulator